MGGVVTQLGGGGESLPPWGGCKNITLNITKKYHKANPTKDIVVSLVTSYGF